MDSCFHGLTWNECRMKQFEVKDCYPPNWTNTDDCIYRDLIFEKPKLTDPFDNYVVWYIDGTKTMSKNQNGQNDIMDIILVLFCSIKNELKHKVSHLVLGWKIQLIFFVLLMHGRKRSIDFQTLKGSSINYVHASNGR